MYSDRPSLARRFNQLRIDHERIVEVEREIFELQQIKHRLEHSFFLRKSRYEADQRAWFESTHPTVVPSRITQPSDPTLEEIIDQMLCEEIMRKEAANGR